MQTHNLRPSSGGDALNVTEYLIAKMFDAETDLGFSVSMPRCS